MMIDSPFQGQLFTADFLKEAVFQIDGWIPPDDDELESLKRDLREIFEQFPAATSPHEPHTEEDLIWPVLKRLGWTAYRRQVNLSTKGREEIPDGLLFANQAVKSAANEMQKDWQRCRHGLAIVESKRWGLALDRKEDDSAPDRSTPATQMLGYLRSVDDITEGGLRWGILTNGRFWRLYWRGAQSVADQFFEMDLAQILDVHDPEDRGLFALDEAGRRHWLRVFFVIFGRAAFLAGADGPETFHQRAVGEGRRYAAKVAANLSGTVFDEVFPRLANAIAGAAPDEPLEEVREATLVLLYRLLFILYAEDRDLLPMRNDGYLQYALRDKVRLDVRDRKKKGGNFSPVATAYWSAIDNLCQLIDRGDGSLGLPAYNGGLFDRSRMPLLAHIHLPDIAVADIVDALSFLHTKDGEREYINFRSLGVQQIGSIYERLIERELHREDGAICVRPNNFVRKDWGSYYTPDELVALVIKETVGPLVEARLRAFEDAVEAGAGSSELAPLDPAVSILDLKICDPAMGSGHFLVNLVDWLADRVIEAMAAAEAQVKDYVSPLVGRISDIRRIIRDNAEAQGWTIGPDHLDDRHIVRRMVLKRCVFGTDKNPMAVELAKVSLWLHTFTVGAPLSFLDHHLRCGDSLFGAWAQTGIERATKYEAPLMLHQPLRDAIAAAEGMRAVEEMTDAEIEEVKKSAETFMDVQEQTAPLDALLSLIHGFDWLDLRGKDDKEALRAFFSGGLGDPVEIALNREEPKTRGKAAKRFVHLLERARTSLREEGFLNWEAAFPGIWTGLENAECRKGGFDAVIGNPPWDRAKLQEVEWFAARKPGIAREARAADRKRRVAALLQRGGPLAEEYRRATERSETMVRVARQGGDYPLLSRGDTNLYSLFVERALALAKPNGMVGLLVPSGIGADKTAAHFFRSVATEGRLKVFYDFENGRSRFKEAPPFFPSIHRSQKFCVFVASPSPIGEDAQCAFFLHDVSEIENEDRRFSLSAEAFARVNPNLGTAPVFRSKRDAELTTAIYGRLPVLVDRSSGEEVKEWPVNYQRMFDMTQDSHRFRTRADLEEKEGAWPIGSHRYDSASGEWVPLYQGMMAQAYDHRAASVIYKPNNLLRPLQPMDATVVEHQDPDWSPTPYYWVPVTECRWRTEAGWVLGFKDVTAPTNSRSMIASLIPRVGAGNTLPLLTFEDGPRTDAALLLGNLNSIPFDFVARQKIQGQHLNLFIVEQLPVVPLATYATTHFGPKTAAEIVREAVLELTYTAHDMAPFARDMGYVDEMGDVLPPFPWNEDRRLRLRSKLDALYFHLYGVTDRDDVRYIYSTFPTVEREENREWGSYRSRDFCLAWISALAAGRPDSDVNL